MWGNGKNTGLIDFSKYVNIPEVDPITGETHHEWADHNHLLKGMAKHARDEVTKILPMSSLMEPCVTQKLA